MLSLTSFQSCFRLQIYIKRSSNTINVPLRNTSVFGKNVFLRGNPSIKTVNTVTVILYNFIYITEVFRPKAMKRRVNNRQTLFTSSALKSKALINTPLLTLHLEEPCYTGATVQR